MDGQLVRRSRGIAAGVGARVDGQRCLGCVWLFDWAARGVLCPGCFLLTGLSVLSLDRADLTLLGSPASAGKQFDGVFVLKKRRGATLETFGSRYYCCRYYCCR